MKRIAGCVFGAVVLLMLGGLCLGASRLDDRMAQAQQRIITSDYDAAEASLQAVEPYYQYASRLPWIGDGPLNDVRARLAAIDYWQRKYGALLPANQTDAAAGVGAYNVPLQMIAADSIYRDGQPRAKDRTSMMQVLDASIEAYRNVLSNARRPEDAPYAEVAAFNYEYVARLRAEVGNGRRKTLPPAGVEQTFGAEGKPEDATFQNEFKQYVPLEKNERDEADPGKSPAPVRKG